MAKKVTGSYISIGVPGGFAVLDTHTGRKELLSVGNEQHSHSFNGELVSRINS